MTEEFARRALERRQWWWNEGAPYCPHCEGTDIRSISTRPNFRCNDCRRWFSTKSEGVFRWSRLTAKQIVKLVVALKRERSISAAGRRAGVSYKTAYRFNKLLAEWNKFWVEETAHD